MIIERIKRVDGDRMNNRTLIVVLTWNRIKTTKKTLKSLLEHNDELDILFIDNCSIDGTAKYLAKVGYEVIRNHTNEGIFRASTKAWLEGVNMGYDFILNLQNDFPCRRKIPFKILEKYLDDNNDVGFIRLNKKQDKPRNMITGKKIRYGKPEKFGNFSISKCNYHAGFNPALIRASIIKDFVEYHGDNPRERVLMNNFASMELKCAKLMPEVFKTLPQGSHKGNWRH